MTTDICGKKDSHAIRLDKEAVDAIKKTRLHPRIATAIFFESNGGQTKVEATIPEIRLAVAEPDLDIGNIETCLESLTEACYFLTVERNRYHFSLKENLNKRFADRRAGIQPPKIEERVREEIQKVFGAGPKMERAWFPEQSNHVLDRPVLTLAVLVPEHSMEDKTKTLRLIESVTRECGASGRTYKNALIWCVPDSSGTIHDEARKVLAWENIEDERDELHLDDSQKRQLEQNLGKAKRDLKESVWRTYKNLVLLGKDNQLGPVDLGLINSSQADSLVSFILGRLRQDGEVEASPSPNFLVRNWPPAFKEWSTKSVRDAFFASPQFPRLLEPEAAKGTIARGVEAGLLAYVGKAPGGDYEPFVYACGLDAAEVEISDDMYIVTKETAEEYKRRKEKPPVLTSLTVSPSQVQIEPAKKQAFLVSGIDQYGHDISAGKLEWKASGGIIGDDGVYTAGNDEGNFLVTAAAGALSGSATVSIAPKGKIAPPAPQPQPARGTLRWTGEVPPQKWMNFYTKVLSKFAVGKELKLQVSFQVDSEQAVSAQRLEETRSSLQEMGLNTDIRTE